MNQELKIYGEELLEMGVTFVNCEKVRKYLTYYVSNPYELRTVGYVRSIFNIPPIENKTFSHLQKQLN